MSNLHKTKVAHAKMTGVEKEHCECELCKNSNVGKSKRRVENKSDKTMEEMIKNLQMSAVAS